MVGRSERRVELVKGSKGTPRHGPKLTRTSNPNSKTGNEAAESIHIWVREVSVLALCRWKSERVGIEEAGAAARFYEGAPATYHFRCRASITVSQQGLIVEHVKV